MFRHWRRPAVLPVEHPAFKPIMGRGPPSEKSRPEPVDADLLASGRAAAEPGYCASGDDGPDSSLPSRVSGPGLGSAG